MQGSANWAIVEGRLVSGQDVEIAAFCDAQTRYLEYHPDLAWDLRSMVAIVWDSGVCTDAQDTTVSGQPGLFCEYDYNDVHWLQYMTIVGDKWVTIQGAVRTSGGAAEADARAMLDNVALQLD